MALLPPKNNNSPKVLPVSDVITLKDSENFWLNTKYNTTPSISALLLKSPLKRTVPIYGNLDIIVNFTNVPEHQPLKTFVSPKLVIPEQAYTSLTSRKSPENHGGFDTILSPTSAKKSYYPMQQHAKSTNSNKSFGIIFRNLSQKRNQPFQPSTLQPPESQYTPHDNAIDDCLFQGDNNYGLHQGTPVNNTNTTTSNSLTVGFKGL